MISIIAFVVLAIVVVAICIIVTKSRHPRVGEFAITNDLEKKYNSTAENRPEIKIDPQCVPEYLRDLIPIAEKWGIGDDVIRADFEEKTTDSEKEEFKNKLKGRTKQVNDWLDSFNDRMPMSEEAGYFMYMLEALAEMKLWPD